MPRKIKRKPRKRETNIYDVLIHAVTKLTWCSPHCWWLTLLIDCRVRSLHSPLFGTLADEGYRTRQLSTPKTALGFHLVSAKTPRRPGVIRPRPSSQSPT